MGSDADMVIFSPLLPGKIENKNLHQHVDDTVFEGWQVVGQPIITISRGRVAARAGQFVGEIGHGRFAARRR